jgi:hypothetical protein
MNKSLASFWLFIIWVSIMFALYPGTGWAGFLVFGPETFQRETGEPQKVLRAFSVDNPSGTFWLQVSNGSGGKNLVSSAVIWLNGEEVVGPEEFNQQVLGFSKDLTLQADNVLEVEVRGIPGSFLTIEVREVDPNPSHFNPENDLWGLNYGDFISLWWAPQEGASEYILSRSFSSEGPWEEDVRTSDSKAVDFTPDARVTDLCYRVEALDANSVVIRSYDPVCIPKFVENPQAATSNLKEQIFANTLQPYNTTTTPQPYNTMCLSDAQFVDVNTMTLQQIKTFLADRNSFLRTDIEDVDGVIINPAQLIFDAAQEEGINPQVLLTTMQKESGAVKLQVRPKDPLRLQLIMGFSSPSTIRDQINDAAAQFRRDLDRLNLGNPTFGGWQVGEPRQSVDHELDPNIDPILVTPATKAVAVLFSYNPVVGEGWGGAAGRGGNFLFCAVWSDFGFSGPSTACDTPQTCGTYVVGICGSGSGCPFPICAQIAEGGGVCVEGSTRCASVPNCTTSADCGSGEFCVVNTCCGVGKCAPEPVQCPTVDGSSSSATAAEAEDGAVGPTLMSP